MRLPTRVLTSIAIIGGLTACGGPATTSDAKAQPALFPVTIMRTGGVAGFQDVLTVEGSGLVSVTRKGQPPQQCRLDPEVVEQLRTSAAGVPWTRITAASTKQSFPDDLITTLQSPAGGPVRLEDPKVGAGGQVFRDLVNEVTGGPAGSLNCTPL